MRTILVTGSVIGIKRGLDDGNAGTDPAILENALGVTWDTLDLCLSYGLSAAQAKALLTVRPYTYRTLKHVNRDALRGDDGGVEQGVGGVAGDRGVVPEVGDGLVHEHLPENLVDRFALRVRRIVGLALSYLHPRDVALQPAHQAGEPRPLAPVGGELPQNGDGNEVQRLRAVSIFGRHRLTFRLRQVIVPTLPRDGRSDESGVSA